MGALMHDIGQAKMPQGVLSKPSALNDNEMQVVKKQCGAEFRFSER